MKTIFRYTNIGLLTLAIFAAGAMATFAQDDCTDAAGQTTLYEAFLAKFPVKTIEGRKTHIELGKQFIEKYGSCETAKVNVDYFKEQIPKWEAIVKKMEEEAIKNALLKRFDDSLKSKNWDETYASGKEILTRYPAEFRVVKIVLASAGGEQAFKQNFKYNDDAVRFAKASIADLEANESFKVGDKVRYGLSDTGYNFEYKTKEDALGWMNLYIGYILQVDKKDKTAAAPFLYKATQATSSEASKNPVSFELIGSYYFDELNKVVEKIQAAAKLQSETDPPEVAQKKVDEIKALIAMSNGISERAMDAFARAYTLHKDPATKARMKQNVQDAYKVRYAKEDGVDAWIASAVARPFVNPLTPVAPVSDPEPAKTTVGSDTPPAPNVGAANGTGMGGAKPATTGPKSPAKPATATAKPGAIKN